MVPVRNLDCCAYSKPDSPNVPNTSGSGLFSKTSHALGPAYLAAERLEKIVEPKGKNCQKNHTEAAPVQGNMFLLPPATGTVHFSHDSMVLLAHD